MMGKAVKRAHVIRHLAFEDLGSFAAVLAEREIEVVYYEAAQDDLTEIDADSEDPLIILGGPISANQTEIYPFLETELKLLRKRLPLDKPTLGICLGAQLIAKALGAKIYAGAEKEIGWSELSLSTAGETSLLRHFAPPAQVLHWHGETFDLPAGCETLGSTPGYANQAFAYGERVLALQFHAECTARGLESWYLGHAAEIEQVGVSIAELRQQAVVHAATAEIQARHLFADWLSCAQA